MILHISPDDPFINYVVKHFDQYGNSDYVVVQRGGASCEVKYSDRVKLIHTNSEILELQNSLSLYNAVIFHGLFGEWSASLLNAVPENVVVAWMCWGGEVYGRENMDKWLAPYSKLVYHIKQYFRQRKNKVKQCFFVPIPLFRKISYCLLDMQEELDYTNRLFSTSMKMLPYNYYTIEDTIRGLKDSFATGNNVFVGNCCAIDGNLPDVYVALAKCYLKGFNGKVISPLSYGELGYRKWIYIMGKLLLGRKFVPLIDYLPLEEYNKIIYSCGAMIQAQHHPQAQGNIITALWLGMRVYLYEDNLTYKYFKRLGVNIFSLNEIFKSKYINSSPLNRKETQHNRDILKRVYGTSALEINVLHIINELDKNHI